MGYVDEEGYFHSSEPEPQKKPVNTKSDGCLMWGCGGCLVTVIIMFVIIGLIGLFVARTVTSMVESFEYDESAIESYFEEYEDDIMDILDEMEGVMNQMDGEMP